MRKALFLAVVICLISVVSAQAADSKIVIFSSRLVAARCEPFTTAQKKLETQFAPERKKLEAQAQALEKQAADLQNQRATLTREALADKSDAFMRAKRNFEDQSQAFGRKAESALVRVNQEFTGRLLQACQEYGARKGLTMLIDGSNTGVLYFDRAIDVTDDIVKEVARAYKENKPLPSAGGDAGRK